MNILISSDMACDMPKEFIDKYKIELLPLPILLGENTYLDGINITAEDIFKFVDENNMLPKTSAINQQTYREFFEEKSKQYDAVIHFTLSHKASSCYNNAMMAKSGLDNVYVVDSYTITSGIAIQILKAVTLREKGLSAPEIIKEIENTRHLVYTSFIVEKLDFLHKGGRCSGLQLFGANMLKIRPSIKVTNGELKMHKKFKGRMENAVEEYVIDTLNENPNYDNKMVIITYSSATPEMLSAVKSVLKKHSTFKTIVESRASGTITSHCGRNTLGIIFYNKEK